MATTVMHDHYIFRSLSIVRLEGFAPEEEGPPAVDLPGSANFLVENFGLTDSRADADEPDGILWTDYDTPGNYAFSALIDTDEVGRLKQYAKEAGYTFISQEEIDEACYFGDGGGVAAIVKHPEGWIVLE